MNAKPGQNLKALLAKFDKTNQGISIRIDGADQLIKPDTEGKEMSKEIIRRLRIQNKKLFEQVVRLKEEIKKTRFNKTTVLNHINELLKLINKN